MSSQPTSPFLRAQQAQRRTQSLADVLKQVGQAPKPQQPSPRLPGASSVEDVNRELSASAQAFQQQQLASKQSKTSSPSASSVSTLQQLLQNLAKSSVAASQARPQYNPRQRSSHVSQDLFRILTQRGPSQASLLNFSRRDRLAHSFIIGISQMIASATTEETLERTTVTHGRVDSRKLNSSSHHHNPFFSTDSLSMMKMQRTRSLIRLRRFNANWIARLNALRRPHRFGRLLSTADRQ